MINRTNDSAKRLEEISAETAAQSKVEAAAKAAANAERKYATTQSKNNLQTARNADEKYQKAIAEAANLQEKINTRRLSNKNKKGGSRKKTRKSPKA
jgi:hypothetical protein